MNLRQGLKKKKEKEIRKNRISQIIDDYHALKHKIIITIELPALHVNQQRSFGVERSQIDRTKSMSDQRIKQRRSVFASWHVIKDNVYFFIKKIIR